MRTTLGLILSLVLLLSACTSGGSGSTTPVVPTTEPGASTTTEVVETTTSTVPPDGYGGEVVIGVQAAPTSLNPFDRESWGERIPGNAVWARTFHRDPETWEMIPHVVTDLPSRTGAIDVAEDGTMIVTYEIVDDAVWSDGEPITGEDLAWTALAMRELALGGSLGRDSVLAEVVEADSVGRLAFITFERPNLAFESELWIVLPSHVLDGVDLLDGTDGLDWPSGGPFVVEEADPGNSITFTRNDSYWETDGTGGSLPYLDRLVVRGSDSEEPWDSEGIVEAFLSGEVDVVDLPRYLPAIDQVRAAEGEGAAVQSAASTIIEHVTFQFGDGRFESNELSSNEDIRLRRAIASAVDREALIEEAQVPWVPMHGLADPTSTAWMDGNPFDADALVAELGEDLDRSPASVLSTTGNADERPAIAEALDTQLTSTGIDYQSELLDSVLFFGEVFDQGTYDVGMWAWSVEDPLGWLRVLDPAEEPPSGDFGRWSELGSEASERFSEIRLAAESTVSRTELDALVSEAESILAEELPLIPLFARAAYSAHWTDAVSGVVPNGTSSELTWNLAHWQKPGE